MARKDPISHLGRHAIPSETLVREVLALGKPAVPRLCGVATNRAGWAPEDTYENKAARSAIFVLRRLGDPAAVPALVEVFTEAPADSAVARSAAWALPGFGAAVVEPILPHAVAGERWIAATEVLAECGARDERIAERIRALLAAEPGPGGDAARSYGDPALVPDVRAAFDALLAAGEPAFDTLVVLGELMETLIELGDSDETRLQLLRGRIEQRERSVAGKRTRVAALEATIQELAETGGLDDPATLDRLIAEVKRLKD